MKFPFFARAFARAHSVRFDTANPSQAASAWPYRERPLRLRCVWARDADGRLACHWLREEADDDEDEIPLTAIRRLPMTPFAPGRCERPQWRFA